MLSSSTATILNVDPELAVWLRSNPRLHTLHFSATIEGAESLAVFSELDDLDSSGTTGRIRSLRHGGEELLHVQLRVENIGVPSYDVPNRGDGQGKLVWRPVLYVGGEWSDAKSSTIHSEPVMREFTDCCGSPVPLEILDKMWEMEGMEGEEWAGRGVEVGDEAWQILIDWREGLVEWPYTNRTDTRVRTTICNADGRVG